MPQLRWESLANALLTILNKRDAFNSKQFSRRLALQLSRLSELILALPKVAVGSDQQNQRIFLCLFTFPFARNLEDLEA